jgi:arginyl-tRNA synthetase
MNLRSELERRIRDALAAAGAPDGAPALIVPSKRPEFGDYQANGCMAAGKAMKTNPRQLAEQVVAAAQVDDLAEKLEIAGPGFINITLRSDWLGGQLAARLDDERLGVDAPPAPRTVVVDYSSPNLAKEMHVGHLRSTIIGDALARILDFLGHTVIRQNHVGDWGTQFGMLTAYVQTTGAAADELADLENFYRAAKAKFDEDADFAQTARNYVVKLQGGDAEVRALWENFRAESLEHCQKVYNALGVQLTEDDVRGESAYNDDLSQVVEDLKAKDLLQESQGAQCVFLEEFKDKEGEILPVLVQKSDGGYLYATTDLAAMRYRAGQLGADRILYVTDSRQGLHFQQVFAVARKAGFVGDRVSLEHVGFGMMMGNDNRPFKTREGGTIKLMDLLAEAQQRAAEQVTEKSPGLPDEQRQEIARVVGMGAVKYADLSQNRSSDYVFSWDKMLALEGNTAPYMQYAYARVKSIFRKGESTDCTDDTDFNGIVLEDPAERVLGVKLAQFPETVETVAAECLPNLLCGYLYELAGAFMSFYENCPVLKADDETRASRLALCHLTAETIKKGLGLLGIGTIEQM